MILKLFIYHYKKIFNHSNFYFCSFFYWHLLAAIINKPPTKAAFLIKFTYLLSSFPGIKKLFIMKLEAKIPNNVN